MNEETPSSEQQAFTYDNSEQPEYETNYEPEREFVLMPLFRRMGEMLGIRRNKEPEYVYTPESLTGEKQASVAVEPEPVSVVDRPAPEVYEQVAEAPAEVSRAQRIEENDVLGIEPEIAAEPLIMQSQAHFEPEPELPSALPPPEPEPEPVVISQAEPEPEPQFALSETSNDVYAQPESPAAVQFEPSVEHVQPVVAARSEAPQPQEVRRALTQDDIKELVAPIREAAVSISLAISQAAEWLHNKEEEVLRRAEALTTQTTEHRTRGPQLVDKRPRVPFWKRIDWDKEFTPRRAAILGAVAMAVLMVLGISLARRPASSVLPQQTKIRAIEPGGVTLTAHPAAAAPLTSQHRSTATVRSAAPPVQRAHRSAAQDDGPDVVTHYYGNKSKPSPTHQSTIAGVRHYSDMQ